MYASAVKVLLVSLEPPPLTPGFENHVSNTSVNLIFMSHCYFASICYSIADVFYIINFIFFITFHSM